MVDDLTRSITDLLARAEAAEARCKLAEKCFDDSALHACETQLELEKKARAEAEARAEKAEKKLEAAVKWIREFTESIDQPCVACKHDTVDFVALCVCGGCSKENDKWEWNGGQEEE